MPASRLRSTRSAARAPLLNALGGLLILASTALSGDQKLAGPAPATAEAAALICDLRAFPMMPGATLTGTATLARLNYQAPGQVLPAFEFQREQLKSQAWNEQPGTYLNEQSSSGCFERDGFKLSVSVSPAPPKAGDAPAVYVSLFNHGNVETSRLPVPPGAQPFYQTPITTAYLLEGTVEPAAKSVTDQLISLSWEPYGQAGDSHFFRQNAIRLQARVSTAPAQAGKTFLEYSTELLAAELPAPPGAQGIQYSDGPSQLFFDSADTQEAVADFYRQTLQKSGWRPTTENLIQDSFKHFLIFRNSRLDLLNLELTTVEGKTRVLLRHQSAAEVAELERLANEELLRRQQQKMQPKPTLRLTLPAGTRLAEKAPSRLELVAAPGKARAIVENLRNQLKSAGWKEDLAVIETMFGNVSFSKASQSITLTFVETGVTAPEITILAIGVDLDTTTSTPAADRP